MAAFRRNVDTQLCVCLRKFVKILQATVPEVRSGIRRYARPSEEQSWMGIDVAANDAIQLSNEFQQTAGGAKKCRTIRH